MDTGSGSGSAATFKMNRRRGRLTSSYGMVLEELNGEIRDFYQPLKAVIPDF
jgi:hypothetical protein